MSAPVSRRSVSLRRPIVNIGLSIGTIRRPSASVTTRRGDPAMLTGTPDYNGRIRTHEGLMTRARVLLAGLLCTLATSAATIGARLQTAPAPAAAPPGGASSAPFWT